MATMTIPPEVLPSSPAVVKSSTAKRWRMMEPDAEAVRLLAESTGMPVLIASLMLNRGVNTAAETTAFLAPETTHLHSPFLMLGMEIAVERILSAIRANETILIYGDYDVDGTTAIVLLKTALDRIAQRLGSTATVRYHVPHRIREGYGMQGAVVTDAFNDGVSLVISVDTGIREHAVAEQARKLGLDLIVTDHHLPNSGELPYALAVLNPNQPGCEYPCKSLCGAGVAFKLAQALLMRTEFSKDEEASARLLPSFLKLLTIATIADSVPLQDENRVIASIGLRELRRPVQPGLRALIQFAELDPARRFTAMDVAFRLAPRINAAGRMDDASEVVEMFLTRDAQRAKEIAGKLHRLNEERRAAELAALTEIDRMLDTDPDLATALCVVVDNDGWHRGVIGILASRIVERTALPALVIAHEDGIAHGSGRSIAGFSLLDALTSAHEVDSSLFTRFGGHAAAAGFTLPSDRVPELRRRVLAYAAKNLTDDLLAPEIACDAELPLDRITPALATWLHRFEPFGVGNPEPVFIARRVRIAADPRILKDRHLRLRVQQGPRGGLLNALGWNMASRVRDLSLTANVMVDIAYRLRENTHPDFGGLELELVDIQV
jgi:single-stranded-DNA-specific exonuclease